MDGRQRADLEPARGAADGDRVDGTDRRQQHDHEQGDRHAEERDRDEPEIAIVDLGHHGHGDEPKDGPLDLRTDGRERICVS